MTKRTSVVVLDPLSLYVPWIKLACDRLKHCLESKQVLILALAPFSEGEEYDKARNLIEVMAYDIFDHVYPRTFHQVRGHAPCHINVCTPLELKRSLMNHLWEHATTPASPEVSPYLRQGTARA